MCGMEKLYQDFFRLRGLSPTEPISGLNPAGRCFSLDPKMGRGFYWIYNVSDSLSISIMDQEYRKDCLTEIEQPDYLTLGYYESVSGEVLTPYRRLLSGSFHTEVGVHGTYRIIHHKGFPIRGISITMMPEYYEKTLLERYPDVYRNPRNDLASIDGVTDFPELVSVFMQIKNYMGDGMAARMFYESKVNEILSLVAGHVQSHAAKKDLMPAAADLSAMISVASYIDDHYSEQIPLDFLCKIACMSKAKLMHDFKATYHISIHQYQQSKRIAHADQLLRDTNLSISEIANLTGYGNQGSFSDVYRKFNGVSPRDARKNG